MRWKQSMNENAKAPAFWNEYPELDHNEVCGWGQHGDVTRQVFTLVELRHGLEHPQLARRVAATRELIEEALHQVLTVEAEGEGRLAQLLDLIHLGDWTSYYLALDNDVDPGPIDAIMQLKAALGQVDGAALERQKCVVHHGAGCARKNRSARRTAPVVTSRTLPAAANVDTATPPR